MLPGHERYFRGPYTDDTMARFLNRVRGGHDLADEDVRVERGGRRRCRLCKNENARKRRSNAC